ncbi:hypothetical protein KSP40_PGU001472 [Platanthera guangdongensis]|uniref:SAP domain-containing protein n=1 Tax=Platanthera guangdongensis TaxID=2320717 RepID=A0ABR2M2G6_9ASPA
MIRQIIMDVWSGPSRSRLEKCETAKSMWVTISELMGGSKKAGICCQQEDEAYVGVLASEDEGKDQSDSIRAPVSLSENEEEIEESSSDEADTMVSGASDNNSEEQVTSSSFPFSLEVPEDRNSFPSKNPDSLKRALQKGNLLVEEQAQEIAWLKILLVLQLASNKVKDSKISDLESSLENEKRIVSNFSKVDAMKRKEENGWISRIINSWRNGETVFRPPTPGRKGTHHAFRYDHRNNRGHCKGDLSSCGDTHSARAVMATHERIPKAHSEPFVFSATAPTRQESAGISSQNASLHPRTQEREVRSHAVSSHGASGRGLTERKAPPPRPHDAHYMHSFHPSMYHGSPSPPLFTALAPPSSILYPFFTPISPASAHSYICSGTVIQVFTMIFSSFIEFDFKSLKRKDLQRLCEKHGLRANSTNSQMADGLASLFKNYEFEKQSKVPLRCSGKISDKECERVEGKEERVLIVLDEEDDEHVPVLVSGAMEKNECIQANLEGSGLRGEREGETVQPFREEDELQSST